MANDPYAELSLPRSASADEVRKAFRKLAKQYHPDANPGNDAAEERFKRISAAFDILGDPAKRARFDKGEIDAEGRETYGSYGGRNPFNTGGGSPGGGGQRGPGFNPGASSQFEDVDLSDILGGMFGSGGQRRSGFGGFGGGGGFDTGPAPRGTDVRAKLEIDLEDAILGGKRRLTLHDGRSIDVTVPKGAADGQTLRLKGQGQGARGGPGDALVEIAIRPHAIYRREGDTLVMDVPISVPDAVLGGKVTAPTPDGPVALSVPRSSNSGQTLRLKGRGMPDGKGKRGDLLARLVVTLPDMSDDELVAFSEKWRDTRPYTPKRR